MTFLEKYGLLKNSVPFPAVRMGPEVTGSAYVDYIYTSKNCYYGFDILGMTDSLYTFECGLADKLVDCYLVTESEKCYECLDSNKCSNCTYSINCNSCIDCHFSEYLISCTDCFGCVALTHKKYCIFNRQYSKEDYFRGIKELMKWKPEKVLKQVKELKKQIPIPASVQLDNENCPYGDYIYYSKNCYWCFNAYYSENSGYCHRAGPIKSCWDLFLAGGSKIENYSINCYEIVDSADCYNCGFLLSSDACSDCYFGEYLKNCSDCFGCVGLVNKKYCILNNQLTKERYEKAVVDIKKELGWRV